MATSRRAAGHRAATPLDDIAEQIIDQLRQDGRRPYASIGRAVGLSEAAVRQRVQRLLEAGVIQIVAVSDPNQFGLRRQALIGIRATGDLEQTAAEVGELDEVAHVVITAGSFDLFAEVLCRDDDHLLAILARLRAVPTVLATEVFVYLSPRTQARNGRSHRVTGVRPSVDLLARR